jgi:hypothetical protein
MSNIKRYAPYAAAVLGVISLKVASKQAPKMIEGMMGKGGPLGK